MVLFTFKKSIFSVVVLSSSIVLSACDTTQMAQQLGTLQQQLGAQNTQTRNATQANTNNSNIGSMITGVINQTMNQQMAGTNNADLWNQFGPLATAFVGSQINQYLNPQDQQKMANATFKSFESGKAAKWVNPDANIRGATKVLATKSQPRAVKMPVQKSKVTEVPPLDFIGSTYRANNVLNVRGGPGTDYKEVGKLSSGQVVQVVGKVKGKSWYLISQNGVGNGFVHSDLLQPAKTFAATPIAESIPRSDIKNTKVANEKVCRTVEQSITLEDGSNRVETIEACLGPDGWKQT